ncbi:E3 ubiquitin-protein ligase pub23 [Phtheirospermum japonicum]|uniref:U-box domain-containing protein n=1 Tax=Phtheirospermum japonicum TaxID=374723 RepID=A0A830D3A6_9LAMI|nr:E3 ubiquitin-protein ligase pub23 [Phtheirospermum japonicum]
MCPITKQALTDPNLTPNHTPQRLIQAWCTLNPLDKIPTPKPPVEKFQIIKILKEAQKSPRSRVGCLQLLRSIAGRDKSSKSRLQAAGAVEFLLSVVRKNDDVISRDVALSVLLEMELSDSDLKAFFGSGHNGGDVLEPLIQVLENGDCKNRAQTILLLKEINKGKKMRRAKMTFLLHLTFKNKCKMIRK